jgi:hypothetical protein
MTMKLRGNMRNNVPFVVIASVLLSASGCGQHPRINVVARILDDNVVFDISAKGVNQVYGLSVEDEAGNEIWSVNDAEIKDKQPVVYGALPERSGVHAGVGQVYPAENKAPADIRGKTVTVIVRYQYDDGFSACAGSSRKTVPIP